MTEEFFGSFITATAILMAILFLRAQLWHTTWKIYNDKLNQCKSDDAERRKIDSHLSRSLGWVYFALLLAVVAFCLTAWRGFVSGSTDIPTCAKWLLGFSVGMTLIEVIFSCVSACLKFWENKPFDEPGFTL
ncbi:hypothetical protein ACFLXT_00770 [Chloroflexota bacterium]